MSENAIPVLDFESKLSRLFYTDGLVKMNVSFRLPGSTVIQEYSIPECRVKYNQNPLPGLLTFVRSMAGLTGVAAYHVVGLDKSDQNIFSVASDPPLIPKKKSKKSEE
jgi:hypothetical protein